MTRLACFALVLSSLSLAHADGAELHSGQWSFTYAVQTDGKRVGDCK